MKSLTVFFATLAMVISISSCMTTFTPSLRTEFSKNKIQMDDIQFYNSEEIELEREHKTRDVRVSKGSYVKEKDYLLETVVICRHTPGGVVGEEGDIIKVSFDENDNKYLPFKLKGSKYVLVSEKGKVSYNGNEYRVTDGEDAYLAINADDSEVEREKEIVLKGRKVVKKNRVDEKTPELKKKLK